MAQPSSKTYPDGTVYPANCVLLETRRGFVLFDTGRTGAQAATLLDRARRTGGPVPRASVTHAHGDRVGGVATLDQPEAANEITPGWLEPEVG